MYRIKIDANGKGNFVYFKEPMTATDKEEATVFNTLKEAEERKIEMIKQIGFNDYHNTKLNSLLIIEEEM